MSIKNCLNSGSVLANKVESTTNNLSGVKLEDKEARILLQEYRDIQKELNSFRINLGQKAVEFNNLDNSISTPSYTLSPKEDNQKTKDFISGINEKFKSEVITSDLKIEPKQELIDAYLKKNNVQYQLNEENTNKNIQELDNYLLDFLKGFNVKTKEFDELKLRLGVDALGATDVLNKLIWYVKNRNEETLPEEASHMLVTLMGENHPDIKELLSNISNWSEYNSIKDTYLPIYNDENKVKIEAVGKLIAKSLVKNYKANGLDKSKLQKALDNIINFIEQILDSLNLASVFMYNQSVADHIAVNVLSGNKDYIYKIKNLDPNLNAQNEINNNPNAKNIIDKFSSNNVKMTGSLAIAGTENIRRPEGKGIHDIDFKVKSFETFEKEVLPKIPENAVPAHYGWHKKSYSTFAYLIPLEGYTIKVLERKDDFSNGWITNYQLFNEENKAVEITQSNVMSVDFFVYKEGANQKDFEFSSDFIPASLVYEGKMSLGGKTNPYFFSRDKDQEDYVLRNPKSFIPFEKHIYYQLPNKTVEQLRAEEKVEMAATDDTEKRKEIYDKYDKLITPLLKADTIKEGVDDIFEQSPELANVGTQQQYSNYLNNIFPDSKVKDIVYHGTKGYDISGKELARFEKFDKSLIGKKNGLRSDDMAKGFYFSSYEIADRVGTRILSAILDIPKENNTTVRRNTKDFDTKGDVFLVFEPEQIHILGNKNDIQGFKDFVNNKTQYNLEKEKSVIINMVKQGLLHAIPGTDRFYFDDQTKVEKMLNKNGISFDSSQFDIRISDKEGNVLTADDLLGGESNAIKSFGNASDFIQQVIEEANTSPIDLQILFEKEGITMSVKKGELIYKQNNKVVKEWAGLNPFVLYYQLKGAGDFLTNIFNKAKEDQKVIDNALTNLYKREVTEEKELTITDKINEQLPNVVGAYKESFKIDPIESLRTIYEQAISSFSERSGAVKSVGEDMVTLAEEYFTRTPTVAEEIDLRDIVLVEDAIRFQKKIRAINERDGSNYTLELKEVEGGLKPTLHTISLPDNLAVETVVNQLGLMFPELDVQVISEDELLDYLPNASPDVLMNTTSFVQGNQVFIIKERVTAQSAVEEMLHPFINAIHAQSPALFDSMYADAVALYPELKKRIERDYKGVYDSEEDIKKEFVTQALRNQYLGIYEVEKKNSLLSKFLDWFKDLWEKFKKTGLNVSDIPANAKLSDMALLLKSGIKINLGGIDTRTFYNLKATDELIYQNVLDKCNEEQTRTVQMLLERTPVVFEEEGHAYLDKETGTPYLSTTTAIKGPLKDEGRNKLNRDIGTQLDIISQAVILGKSMEDIMKERIDSTGVDLLATLSDNVIRRFHESFTKFVAEYEEQGYVIFPQLRLGDRNTGLAGSPDLLVIDPDGNIYAIIDLKTSKNRIDSNKASTAYSSLLINPNTKAVESITTTEQHSLQVQTYRELVRLLGKDVETVMTLHYTVGINDEAQQAVFIEIDPTTSQEGGIVNHDQVVLKPITPKSTEKYNLLNSVITTRATEADYTAENPSGKNNMEDITKITSSILDTYHQRIAELKRITSSELPSDFSGADYLRQFLQQLEKTVNTAQFLFNDNQPLKAYELLLDFNIAKLSYITRVVQNHHKQLDKITNSKEKEDYMNKLSFFVEKSEQDVALAGELARKMSILRLSDELEDKRVKLEKVRLAFAEQAETFLSDTFIKFWATNTSRIDISLLDIKEVFESKYDITDATYYLRDLATSNSKILALIDRYFKFKQFEVSDAVRAVTYKFEGLGNDIMVHEKDARTAYNFMLKMDDDGNPSGSYVHELDWKQYWSYWKKANEALIDPDSIDEKLQYIIDPQNQADRDHNIKVYFAKQVAREFSSAEKYIRVVDAKTGYNKVTGVEEGEFHQYSKEFKDARDKFEELDWKGWKQKTGTDKQAYALYRAKYYGAEVDYYTSERDAKGNPTGELKAMKGSFIKNEYVEKRLITGSGVDLRDPQYLQIQSQANAEEGTLEKAQYNFYQAYIEEYEKGLLSKLSEKDRNKMIGKIGVIEASAHNNAHIKFKGNFFAKFIQTLKDYFSFQAEEAAVFTDETGVIDKKRLPVYFIGDFKNVKNIENLKTSLKRTSELNQQVADGLITVKEKNEKLKELAKNGKLSVLEVNNLFKEDVFNSTEHGNYLTQTKNLLRVEQGKIGKEKLETDLVKNITTFANMAEYFHKMSELENVLEQVEKIILKTSYQKRGNVIDSIRRKEDFNTPAVVEGKDSLTYKRYNVWKDMVFYRNVTPFASKGAQVVRKLMQAMSLRSVGLNVFGQINNYAIGRISNAIDRNRLFGGQYTNTYYDRRYYNKATQEFNKHAATFKISPTKGYYKANQAHTKFEGVIKYFDAVRQNQTSINTNSKGVGDQVSSLGYLMMEKVEMSIQSKTAMSIIMATMVEDKNTGKDVSLYDALQFDEKTGRVEMPDNYIWDKKTEYGVKNLVWEVNKSVHGNYAFEDKITLQATTLGEIGSQFKKFIIPSIDSRLRNRYENEERGIVEGRYLAYVALYKYFRQEKGSFTKAIAKLDDIEKMNMIKNMHEVIFIILAVILKMFFTSLAKGLPPEDKQLKKLMNFLAFQNDRIINDLTFFMPIIGTPAQYQSIKNPIPVLTYMKDYIDILGAAGNSIIGEGVYQSGIRKGDYKIVKEIKDVIPLINLTNKWENFETIKDFYIK